MAVWFGAGDGRAPRRQPGSMKSWREIIFPSQESKKRFWDLGRRLPRFWTLPGEQDGKSLVHVTHSTPPFRHDMIACLGETTGESALVDQFHIMRSCEEGLQILDDRPRINTSTIDFEKLRALPHDTFGYTYWKFLDDNVRNYLLMPVQCTSVLLTISPLSFRK